MKAGHAHRVLYLIETSGRAGAESNLLQLATHLDREHYEPIVRLLQPGWLGEELARQAVDVEVLRGGQWRLNIPLIVRLAGFIRRRRISLVHAYMFVMGVHGALAAFLARVPVIYSVRGRTYELAQERRRRILGLLGRAGCRFTAVTRDIANSLVVECGVPVERVVLVPNGVDTAIYTPCIDTKEARTAIGLDASRFTIGTVARLEPVKGIEYLLHSLPAIESCLGPIQVVIVGDGTLRDRLQRLAGSLPISSPVTFLGLRTDVPRVLRTFDIFVLPSLSEGMPNVLLQAMAAGLPCIATAVGGTPELIRHGETGLLVPSEDPAALAEAVLSLAESVSLRRKLALAARPTAEQEYGLGRMVARNQDLYAALVRGDRNVVEEASSLAAACPSLACQAPVPKSHLEGQEP